MKLNLIFLFTFLVIVQLACQKPQEIIDDKPAIESISFVGIPQQNVQLDAPTSTITVQLPALLPIGGLKPVLELKNGASLVRGLLPDGNVDLNPYCSCRVDNFKEAPAIVVGSASRTTYYRLRVLPPKGKPTAVANDTTFIFSQKTKTIELLLTVENLYSNLCLAGVSLTNLKTNQKVYYDPLFTPTSISCLANDVNKIRVRILTSTPPITNELMPGIYSITVGGIDFPQRLVVTE